jgi:Cdc6-like AAA superfamily ATPase
VKPLRLLLLGTAGTGKTTTVQTALQEALRHLQALRLPLDFIRVAAPTGCAAFNMHFNATTIHRLIHHFRLGHFAELTDKSLDRLQTALKEARIIFLDEVSMIGRQFMGRIDSRFNQAKAGSNPTSASIGGVSFVLSGDPAQCEAISDHQMYDTTAHRETASAGEAKKVQLSNAGLSIYEEFDHVVVLSKIHRLTQLSEAKTEEQRAYNERCVRFAHIQLRMRDMTLTSDDYF